MLFLLGCSPLLSTERRDPASACAPSENYRGKSALPGITLLTGFDLKPFQTSFCIPELADPYLTVLPDSAVISGTAQYHLKFKSPDGIRKGGPYEIVWTDFHYSNGTPMETNRNYAHSWDMKPALWVRSSQETFHLWDPTKDTEKPQMVWYGGHMRPRPGEKMARWPEDHWSRDVFAFEEKEPGRWFSLENSIFSRLGQWPRPSGNFLGHRYGHQMVMVPKKETSGKTALVPAVFYEQVTQIREDGSPYMTKIFMDEMLNPFEARGKPLELISPINPVTGKPFPSAIREDGAILVEGPLYFRFLWQDELWEAIGFSSGSFYGKYPAVFASRKVADGLLGKPFQPDLNEDGSDFFDAGRELAETLRLAGGPGRPAVMIGPDGLAIPGPDNSLQVLVHAYRKDVLPDQDFLSFPFKYRLDQMYRVMIHAYLKVEAGARKALRFRIQTPR